METTKRREVATKQKTKNVAIAPRLHARVRMAAARRGVPIHVLVATALERELEDEPDGTVVPFPGGKR